MSYDVVKVDVSMSSTVPIVGQLRMSVDVGWECGLSG